MISKQINKCEVSTTYKLMKPAAMTMSHEVIKWWHIERKSKVKLVKSCVWTITIGLMGKVYLSKNQEKEIYTKGGWL